eukprot:Skav207853  [mRNA]  locus=scaffold3025:402388:405413:- [translate_table: standard]
MEVAEAVSCFTDEQLHIIPQHVRGQGVSAVAVEFQASPSCETQVELPLSGRFVGKCYKVQGQAGDPPAVALHEFQMLQAAQSCPNVLQTFGLFRVPSLSQMPGFDSKVADQKHCVLLMENCDYSLQDSRCCDAAALAGFSPGEFMDVGLVTLPHLSGLLG